MLWVSNNDKPTTQIFPISKRDSWICQNTGQTKSEHCFMLTGKNWHKWQQYWMNSKLTTLVCLLKELLGVIHPFTTCMHVMTIFFTFFPLVCTFTHLGYSPFYVYDFIDWYPSSFDFARLPWFPHSVLPQNFISLRLCYAFFV